MNVSDLNNKFGISNHLVFNEGPNGIVVVEISSDDSAGKISLYGGHVLSFIPNGQRDLLMVSDASYFVKGKPIRGGIPLCFPWFNIHPANPALPSHGFARLKDWDVVATKRKGDGTVMITLGLNADTQSMELWAFPFYCELEVSMGKELEVKWLIKNQGHTTMEVANALHTYFAVQDASEIIVEGVEGNAFFDSTRMGELNNGEVLPIKINCEVNRIYTDTTADCRVVDSLLNRVIRVKKSGSNSTIVWNPWIETSSKIIDLDNDEYKRFVCVESGNVRNNTLFILAGQSHLTSIVIGCE